MSTRLLSVLHKLNGSTIDGATYTVDNVGNRTGKTNHLPGAPVDAYTYDNIYQLTQVVQNGTTTSENYTYDAVGNRLSSPGASPWSYNSSNQLTQIAGSPGTTFTYDNNGNTLTKTDAAGTTTYTWDYENRLSSVTLPNSGGTASFTYDPLGRRVRKVLGSATTVYAYDDENIVEETDAGGTVAARYAMGLGIDEPLAQLRSSATHFYSADGLGSVTSLTDGSGAVAASYTYDAFGNHAASSGSVTNPFRYTAREWDAETGLYFYRARYYGNTTGRFSGEDPIRFRGGNNFYSYVFNRPTLLKDPSGLAAFGLGASASGIAASLAKGGVAGEGSCLIVGDTKFNIGTLCCWGFGPALGQALTGSVQGEGLLCPTCETICDLEGIYVQGQGFGAAGPKGLSVGFGVSIGSEHLTVGASVGPAAGAGGGFTIMGGECKLVLGGGACKKCPKKQD